MKVGLICITGDDIDAKIVDEATWNWILNPESPVPPEQLELMREQENDPEFEPDITEGTPVFDAAHQAIGITLDGMKAENLGITFAFSLIQKHNLEVIGDMNCPVY